MPLLGPFRLTARTFASPAGVVYSAIDQAGSPLQVVVLTRGAASDAAARDRFAAAVREFGGPLVASDTASSEPWAAGGPGLERTLDPILLRGRARGPQFLPYWAGAEDPAFPSGRSGPLLAPKGERPRGVIPALITLLLLAILLGGLLILLFACQPDDPLTDDDSRVPPPPTATGGQSTPPSSSPGSGSPSESPETESPSQSPDESETPDRRGPSESPRPTGTRPTGPLPTDEDPGDPF
ncbi:hypothetical protein GCM10010468_21440 [Actinocorallia longicatena]|uniref:Uncharacterized protein n=1 Tax=Actinocorallia longicatena TaxID=111803 RepID=A0ABP6Q5U9_9ACTN